MTISLVISQFLSLIYGVQRVAGLEETRSQGPLSQGVDTSRHNHADAIEEPSSLPPLDLTLLESDGQERPEASLPILKPTTFPARVKAAPEAKSLAETVNVTLKIPAQLSLGSDPSPVLKKAAALASLLALLGRYTQQDTLTIAVSETGLSFQEDYQDYQTRSLSVHLRKETTGEELITSCAEELNKRPVGAQQESEKSPRALETQGLVVLILNDLSLASDGIQQHLSKVAQSANIALALVPTDEGFSVVLQGDGARYSREHLERLSSHLSSLWTQLLSNQQEPVASLDFIPEQEKAALIADWAGPEVAYKPVPIHELISAHVVTRGNEIAVSMGSYQITYAELEAQSNQLAWYLLRQGVAKETPVAVCLPANPQAAVYLLGIMKAGGTYVPLDPTHPPDRISAILDDNKPHTVITNFNIAERLSFTDSKVLDVDGLAASLAQFSTSPPDVAVSLEQSAYIVYTSGTTGNPKGVVTSHANLLNYISVARDTYQFQPDDVFSSVAPYTFSITMFEVLTPLVVGGTLRPLDRDHILDFKRLTETLQSELTVMHASPALWKGLLTYIKQNHIESSRFDRMRHVSTGGDMVPPNVLEKMRTTFKNAEIFVIYGSSEISCMGCTYRVPLDKPVTESRVGRPFQNMEVRLLDSHGNMVPPGVPGEIYIGGAGVTKGYLHQPKLSEEKYVKIGDKRFYRMGDIGRRDVYGNLEMLGREDFQIKIRGMRIELGDVENALRQAPGVLDGLVACRHDPLGNPALVAYVVPLPGEINIRGVYEYMNKKLPEYMVPIAFVQLQALPQNFNRKIDRKALPVPSAEDFIGYREYAAPQGPIESTVAQVWQDLLAVNPVGRFHNFFECGGDSLGAVQMLTRVEKKLGLFVSMKTLMLAPTLADFCGALADKSRDTSTEGIVPLNIGADKTPLFCIYGLDFYRDIAKSVDSDQPVYGVYLQEEVEVIRSGKVDSDFASVPGMAKKYIEEIKQRQPVGPYYLAGYSFGGVVALEMAQQLKQGGVDVALVVMFDSHAPDYDSAGSVVQRLMRHVQLTFKKGPTHLVEKVRHRAEVIQKQMVHAVMELAGQLGLPIEEAEASPVVADEARSNMRDQASASYRPGSYNGDVVLFSAEERDPFEIGATPDMGWDAYLPNLRIIEVPGDHHSILRGENAKALGQHLKGFLPKKPTR